jgi:hypothetical protein
MGWHELAKFDQTAVMKPLTEGQLFDGSKPSEAAEKGACHNFAINLDQPNE